MALAPQIELIATLLHPPRRRLPLVQLNPLPVVEVLVILVGSVGSVAEASSAAAAAQGEPEAALRSAYLGIPH